MSAPATSLRVESIFTSTMFGLSLSRSAASSQCGARLLQCPHHGAQNFTRNSFGESSTISLKLLPTATLTGASLVSGTGADFKNCFPRPAFTSAMNALNASFVTAPSNTNFCCLSLRSNTLGVVLPSTPTYSVSRSQSPSPSLGSEKVRMRSVPDSSSSLNASLAESDSALSDMNKNNTGSFLSFWKIFSIAELSKGITSALTADYTIINTVIKTQNMTLPIPAYLINVLQHLTVVLQYNQKYV